VLGFEAEGWWSRAAQPALQAWRDDKPVRLGEQTVPAKALAGNAVACDGLSVPTAHHMLWRLVRGRPVSVGTGALLAWLATYVTAQGQRALGRIGDKASWHVSQAVQEWSTTHNRHAKQEGGGRLMVCRLPSKRPWLKPIAPKWGPGKRAVVEPARVLSMTDLRQWVCAYDECELTDPIAQPDC
jgi:hypothetical protein